MTQQINDLPELALLRVFKHLPLFDQLNVRLVCKKWKLFIEENILRNWSTQLALLLGVAKRPLLWSHNHQPVDEDSSIGIDLDKSLESTFFKSIFRGVKELFVSRYAYHFIYLSDLVRLFPHLEHLEVCNPYFSYYEEIKPIQLDLGMPQLQTLYLDCKINLIHLNCPSLRALSMIGDFHLEKKFSIFSESLRFLKVRSFTHQPDCDLPNLEVICFSRNLEINLTAFHKLKEIHYVHSRNIDYERNENLEYFYDSEAILAALFRTKLSLDRALDIYHSGIKCQSPEEIQSRKQYFFDSEILREDLDCLLKGSSKLKLEYVKKTLAYDEALIDEYKDRLSDESIKKLTDSIEILEILKTDHDSSKPLRIGQKLLDPKVKPLLKYATQLQLSLLPQNVLDEMPALMPSLLYLRSISGYPLECKTINFSFLTRFKGLQDLEVDKDCLSIDLLAKIIEGCKFLSKVRIIENDKPVHESILIWRFTEAEFEIWFRNLPTPAVHLSSWTEVLDHLDRNRVIKRHDFSDFFNENYHLSDLNSVDYFYGQSH